MKPVIVVLALAGSLAAEMLVGSAPASAKMQELSPGRYRCAAPAGRYWEHEVRPLVPGRIMRVRFRFVSENYHSKWPVGAGVHFETPRGRMSVLVGPKSSRTYPFEWLYVALRKNGVTDRIVNRYPMDELIEVRLKMSAEGMVTVRSGNTSASVDLGTTQPKVALHCQSGVFLIDISPADQVPPPIGTFR